MRFRQLGAILLAFSSPALAQPASADPYFGNGKAPIFREQDADRRFSRSGINKILTDGTANPDCAEVAAALLTVLGEIAPTLHKRDENFSVDPALLQVMQQQLNARGFPGTAYVTLMVRRVLIDRKIPDGWLDTAARLSPAYRIIDLAKLKSLASGLDLIDSFYVSLPAIREAHQKEIGRATQVSESSQLEFRDRFLDRTVTWTDLMVVDIGPDAPAGPGGKKRGRSLDEGSMVAVLQELAPRAESNQLMLFQNQAKPPQVIVRAKLSPQQYVDLYRIPKARAVTVRGRLWDMNADLTQFNLRDAQLFFTRDWSDGAVLLDPSAIAQCPAAIDELNGVAPNQQGGFAHH